MLYRGALGCPEIPWQQYGWANQVKDTIPVSILNQLTSAFIIQLTKYKLWTKVKLKVLQEWF